VPIIDLGVPPGGLRKDANFTVSVVMPDHPGWLRVDYFSGDQVLHLGLAAGRGGARQQSIRLARNEKATVFQGQAGEPDLDLIVATVTRDPLFQRPRPEVESVADYLPALQHALASADPANVSAQAIRVVIEP
jgi:hypothetical protein